MKRKHSVLVVAPKLYRCDEDFDIRLFCGILWHASVPYVYACGGAILCEGVADEKKAFFVSCSTQT